MNLLNAILSFGKLILCKNHLLKGTTSFLSLYNIRSGNSVRISNSHFVLSRLSIKGGHNTVSMESVKSLKACINIEGDNNELIVEKGTDLGRMYIAIVGTGCKIHIGQRCNFHNGFMIAGGNDNMVFIGEECLFAHDVNIIASDTHQILEKGQEINPSRDIILKNHVWVCANSSILKGVIIGENSVIGLGSVVSKDLAPNTLNVGNPCKMVKEGISWSIECNSK